MQVQIGSGGKTGTNIKLILKLFHFKLCLNEENMLRDDKHTDTDEMFDGTVTQRVALVAIWRGAAGTVMEGREQVYMSA